MVAGDQTCCDQVKVLVSFAAFATFAVNGEVAYFFRRWGAFTSESR
jgi:hypothetical protein